MLDHYDGIAAVSPVSIKAMRRYLDPKDRIRLIPNGVDTDWFSRRDRKIKGLDDGRPNILYIGRFDPRNGFSKMVEAFVHVKKEIKDARLVVVGYGPLQDYYMSKIPEELREDIVFIGKTDLARPMIYSSCNVICVPAQKAACSVAILEALASETPIVASGIDGFKWIIEHEKEALLVPDRQPRSYADALIRILRDGELRERLTSNGLEKAYTLDWKVVTEEVLQLYYDVLEAEPAEAEETIEPEERPVEVVPLYPAAYVHPTA
jgi:phosphatidylinositol alpha-mannosyltransferase